MSTVSKHIINEIADKLFEENNHRELLMKRLDSISQEKLDIIGEMIDLYEKSESQIGITEEEEKKYHSLADKLKDLDDFE